MWRLIAMDRLTTGALPCTIAFNNLCNPKYWVKKKHGTVQSKVHSHPSILSRNWDPHHYLIDWPVLFFLSTAKGAKNTGKLPSKCPSGDCPRSSPSSWSVSPSVIYSGETRLTKKSTFLLSMHVYFPAVSAFIINTRHVHVVLFVPIDRHITDSWIYRLTCPASQNTEPPTISMRSLIITAASCTVIIHPFLVVQRRRQTIAKRISLVIAEYIGWSSKISWIIIEFCGLSDYRLALHGWSSSSRY